MGGREIKSASVFSFPATWLHATASEVRSKRAAYRWTNCCPSSDLEEILWAQFCDGLLSVRMSSFARLHLGGKISVIEVYLYFFMLVYFSKLK